VGVVIVQKNDCVLVEMMMMMDSFFSSFLYIQDRAKYLIIYIISLGGRGRGDGRLHRGFKSSSLMNLCRSLGFREPVLANRCS